MKEITKSDFVDWKTNLVTKEVFSELKVRKEQYKDLLVSVVGQKEYEQAARVAGAIDGITALLDINYDLVEVMEEEADES